MRESCEEAMNRFISDLDRRKVGYDSVGRPVDRLLAPLGYFSDKYGPIWVPAGFDTNYCSIPRVPVIYLMFADIGHEPGALHDYLYTVRKFSRAISDEIFFEALLAPTAIPAAFDRHADPIQAHLMYQAVRQFGQSSWESETSILQPQHITAQIQEPQREAA
jgi:Protein of unknown function (DUF1353)